MVELHRRHAAARLDARFARMAPSEVFTDVYSKRLWGGGRDERGYCSGEGSRNEAMVGPYVAAVRKFLREFPTKPDVVDLGCGDFHVGKQLREDCDSYTACDVVADLVARNERMFGSLGVDFRTVDLVSDELPGGEVAILRQVLQHLGNAQIALIVPKLYKYRWLILTEHLPEALSFHPNRDKPTGPGVRVRHGSGVVLTAPPFNLRTHARTTLCSVPGAPGVILTVAYRLQL
ncbi:MAG TPA: hypothetical protein VME66_04630 [Candidatus Acidoferrales bacterium]|nr:hypothetical protein [Candidatus Acidoferrales bacterium]